MSRNFRPARRFTGGDTIGDPPPAPRNVLAIREVPGGVEVTIAPGATVHSSRMGGKVVIDVDDSAPVPAPTAAAPGPDASKSEKPGTPKRETAVASGDKTAASTRPPAGETNGNADKPSQSRQNRKPPPKQPAPAVQLTTSPPDATTPANPRPP